MYVPGAGTADVKVEIFTTAFRKVQEMPFSNVQLGMASNGISVPMTDRHNDLLASGLYYVVVTTSPSSNSGGRALHLIGKFLLLR